jgi:tetratricopeptide (TPR) repeat protein
VIGKIEQADATFKNNDYLIALSHLYLAKGANKYQEYFEEFTEKVGDVTKKEEALGYISKARAYAEKATEIDVRDYRVWDNLAYVYKNIETVSGDKSGNLVDIYKKVEDLYPLNYRNYLYYAQKLEEDGDLLGAFRLYKKAYEINPEFEGLKNFIDEIEKELNTIKQ